MLLTPKSYTMKELVSLTGFSPRQIRFYITRKLAPGAGGKGPNVTYGEETLRRLQRIGELKKMKLPPAGRGPTLEEIRRMLDSDESAAELSSSFIAEPEDQVLECRRSSAPIMAREPMTLFRDDRPLQTPGHVRGPARWPLKRLLKLLEELTEAPAPEEPGEPRKPWRDDENWRRVRTPDIEFHVRVPDNEKSRERLEGIAEILRTMLDGRILP